MREQTTDFKDTKVCMDFSKTIKWRYSFLVLLLMLFSILGSVLLTSCSSEIPEETTASVSETVASTNATTSETEPEAFITPVPTPTPVIVEAIFDEAVWYNGFVDPRSIDAVIITNMDDITCVVNKYYALPEDYVPSDLVDCEHSMDQQLRACAAEAWDRLYADCLAATGQEVYLMSGFRDYQMQTYLFERAVNNRGTAFACKRNAYQGRSEHQLGLAMDLTPVGYDRLLDDFGETTAGQWINEHCYEYGFILRYQYQYCDETGYDREGWHYRYVGVELATYLYENDMSLEAYWGMEQFADWDE